MNQHSTIHYLKILLFTALVVCSFFVPMSAQTAKAEGDARAGNFSAFNEQFSGYPSNWTVFKGNWTYGGGVVRGLGKSYDWGEIYYRRSTYRNLDYQVRMRRVGCSNCANSIRFRDSGSFSGVFSYTNSGSYTIGKEVGTNWQSWINWQPTSAIYRGGWNTLRVKAVGDTYWFYINNRLVASGYKSGLNSGFVGIQHYSYTSAGNFLDVDWAVLR
jgi:hypothetical protein